MRGTWWLGVLLAWSLAGAPGQAQLLGLEAEASTGLVTDYVFRGADQQPVSWVTEARASFRLIPQWTVQGRVLDVLRLGDGAALAKNDFDLSLAYRPRFSPVAIRGGYVYYDLNNKPTSVGFLGPDTQEIYLGLDFFVPGRPHLYRYYDFDNAVGLYLTAGASYDFPIAGPAWTLGLGGAIGFDIGRVDGFNDARIDTEVKYHLGDFAVGPELHLWFPADQVAPATDGVRPVGALMVDWGRSF